MLNCDFIEQGLGLVSSKDFMYGFSRKMFLVIYSINWPNFIISLSHCLTSSDVRQYEYYNCFPGCYAINLKINLIFLIKPFINVTKKSRQKIKYLENRKVK